MSVEFLETLAANLLEYDDLVGLCVIIKYGSLYEGALDVRSSNLNLSLFVDEENFVKLHSFTFGLRKSLHKDFVASLNFKLLACNVYDCVHF